MIHRKIWSTLLNMQKVFHLEFLGLLILFREIINKHFHKLWQDLPFVELAAFKRVRALSSCKAVRPFYRQELFKNINFILSLHQNAAVKHFLISRCELHLKQPKANRFINNLRSDISLYGRRIFQNLIQFSLRLSDIWL